jgi:IS605 OrfB family transposase
MKLTVIVKLLPNDEQRHYLLQTLEQANAVCNWMSQQAWEHNAFGQVSLHKLTYYEARQLFGLSSQVIVRCIGKVVDAYKKDKKTQREFKPHGAIAYDDRILSWRIPDKLVSIWTVGNRLSIPFVCGTAQAVMLQYQQGETDLIYRKDEFYLATTCDVPEDEQIAIDGYLGGDMGIKNILTDSDGTIHSGKHLLNVRHRHRRLRKKLQSKGTKSARRRLKKLSGKERRFANDVNHCISKQFVLKAKGTGRGVAIEDLRYIRDRVTVGRRKRDELHSWSFQDLRNKITYKARLYGVPLVAVDPRNTSRTCPVCGGVDARNRPTQAKFSCISCGHASHADYIAAVNISRRASVNAPHVSDAPATAAIIDVAGVAPGTSLAL